MTQKDDVYNYMNKLIDNYKEKELSEEDKEFNKYCELYEKRFKKNAYIAEPDGTKEQTISAIKICLEKNKDLLDEILYKVPEFKIEKNTNIFKRIIYAIKRVFKRVKKNDKFFY